MKLCSYKLCLAILTSTVCAGNAIASWGGRLSAGWQQTLDRQDPRGAFVFESDLRTSELTKPHAFGSVRAERSSDVYETMAIPRLSLGVQTRQWRRGAIQVFGAGTIRGVDLHQWAREGWIVRPIVSSEAQYLFSSAIALGVRLAAFVEAHRYSLTSVGDRRPSYGFQERAFVRLVWRRLTIESSVLFEQALASRWTGSIGFSNSLGFSVDRRLRVGFSHQTDNGIVDGATGRYRSIRVLDSRETRYGLFAVAEL